MAHQNWLCIGDFNQILYKEEKFSFNMGSIVGANLFQQVISELHLCNLVASGQKFTWMNNREEEGFVMERLDRAFASVDWVNSYPQYFLLNLPIVDSNHGPILLNFEKQLPFRKRPFRFELMWINHPSCKDMIHQAWNLHTKGSRGAQLNNKLANVKKEAIGWNKSVFGKVELEIKKKLAELQEMQDSIVSIEDVRKEKILREELEGLLNKEEIMWAQKARNNWVLFGDRNTKYFQTVVRQRRIRRRIIHIKNEDGVLLEDPMEVENRLVNHFKASFVDTDPMDVGFILNEL